MINIAICDDEKYSLANLEKLTREFFENTGISIKIDTYDSGEDFLNNKLDNLNLIFLDVNMQDLNGIEVAKIIRKTNNNCVIIYVSAHMEYAMFGYEVSAYRYLLKNDLEISFNRVMKEIMEKFYMQDEIFDIYVDHTNHQILLKNIVYIESKKRILEVHTENCPMEMYRYYDKISIVDEKLTSKGFLRIQKSYIVNMNYIKDIKGYIVYLNDGQELKATIHNYRDIINKFELWKEDQ